MKFELRNHDGLGYWLTDVDSYFQNAHMLMEELEEVVTRVNNMWPLPLHEPVRDSSKYPELQRLTWRRDCLSDSVRIFSAMSVEAFINYYGVVRLGDSVYKENFERLGQVPKLKSLLLLTDSVLLTKNDTLIILASRIGEQRNALVHPKAKQTERYLPAEERFSVAMPGFARDTLADMNAFFVHFSALIPKAAHLVPKLRQ